MTNILDIYKKQVFPFIDNYLKEKLGSGFHYEITSDYSIRQGKYLRPSLVLMTAGALGVDITKATPVAAAMQMSEDWILNHDDIEDDSLERRGLPTLHRQIGTALALNAGDALHALNWQLIHSLNNESIFQEFTRMINGTIKGQTYEIKIIQDKKFDLKIEEIYKIIESKTCYYTISGPMRLGGILGNLSQEKLQLIYKFGLFLGKAFQIIDDYLDLTSDFSGQKKQIGNDIYEGKRTIFLFHLLQNSKDPKIIEILNKDRSQKSETEVKYIINLMRKHKSLDYGYELALSFAQKAKVFFEKELSFLKKEPYRQQLIETIDFIVNRKK
jgi:geranylgeranyl diphosphate synthase type II